jgi:hypothetical protein
VTQKEGKQRHQGQPPWQDGYGDKSARDVEQRPKCEWYIALGDEKVNKLVVFIRGPRMLPVTLRLPEQRANGVRENHTNHQPAKASHEAVLSQSKEFHDFGSHGTRTICLGQSALSKDKGHRGELVHVVTLRQLEVASRPIGENHAGSWVSGFAEQWVDEKLN